MNLIGRLSLVVIMTFLLGPLRAEAAATCESLKELVLPNTTLAVAESVAAGSFVQPGGGGRGGNNLRDLPAFCRIAVILRPSSDSEIKSEIWLPLNGWNGKFQMFGNGAWAGSIGYTDLANGVRAGYASASTDTGHTNGGPNTPFFAIGHPEKVIDFSYRAVHETTVTAKALISNFYGNAPKFSYFNGCSTGGRQAMAALQRFPRDYDGIIGGSLVFPTHTQGTQVWTGVMAHKTPGGMIPDEKFATIKQAALTACDARDGLQDGVIENPLQCKFDPGVMQCRGGDDANCLTAAQVQTVRSMYEGPKDSRGQSLHPGPAPGSELGWTGRLKQPSSLAIETYQHLVFKDSAWDYRSFDAEKDMATSLRVMGPVMDNDNPDVREFIDRGGKLIIHHGWNDPGVSPYYTVNYYNNVVRTVGRDRADRAVRLFMLPGVGHCGGGDGPDQFDRIGTLDRWVETGKAPEQIIASKVRNGTVERTRPVCAFPMVASYKGSGSTDEAANFVCKAP